MSIGLGGVSLPDDMWIENRFAEHGVAGTFRRTIGGRLLRYETTVTGGAPGLASTLYRSILRRSPSMVSVIWSFAVATTCETADP